MSKAILRVHRYIGFSYIQFLYARLRRVSIRSTYIVLMQPGHFLEQHRNSLSTNVCFENSRARKPPLSAASERNRFDEETFRGLSECLSSLLLSSHYKSTPRNVATSLEGSYLYGSSHLSATAFSKWIARFATCRIMRFLRSQ